MYEISCTFARRIVIARAGEQRLFKKKTYERAKTREAQGSQIRNSIKIIAGEHTLIFTTREWEQSLIDAQAYLPIPTAIEKVRRQEIDEKIKISKNLSKIRSDRIRKEANCFAEAHGIKNSRS